MAKVNLYKKDGSVAGSIELSDAIFAVPAKVGLIHEVIVAQDANSRVQYAHVKDRSEVAGTGKKPWKQKGTGRARHGSRRSPIWSGGGVTFGPNAFRNFFKKINKKMRRKAIAMLLSNKVATEKFVVVDSFGFTEAKTSTIDNLRNSLPGANKKAVIVTTPEDIAVVMAARNHPNTVTIAAHSLNARDLAKYEYVIASSKAIDIINETFSR
jgi:large subunit ribosomal protein L4